jgi:twitching motility protein PilT
MLGPGESRFQELLRRAVESGASDIHLKTGLPPVVRVNDDLRLISRKLPAFSADEIRIVCNEIVPRHHVETFNLGREIDMAYSVAGLGRFRLNIFRHRGSWGLVARYIPIEVRSLEQLGLPEVLKRVALLPRGLVLITGNTGSGKSTTMASMLNEWNQSRGGHIVTIEDPIEYVLLDKKSIITQREIGTDTDTFASGLKFSLRQDPDVIMIGELRDRETISTALAAAETGHLVLSTLHTKDSVETINRVIGVFPHEAQKEVRIQFAASLSAVISQRLLPTLPAVKAQGRSMVAALEIMINTPRIRDLLQDPDRMDQIRPAIEQGYDSYGMQSFDQHLMLLLRKKIIGRDIAVRNASNPADFELKLRGIDSSAEGNRWGNQGKATSHTETADLGHSTLELDDDKTRLDDK